MSNTLELSAETRAQVGKGASRSLRREGRVPAVVYGSKQEAAAIHVEERELIKLLMTGKFFESIIVVNGERTIAKDVAFNVVTDRPIHVDFLRVSDDYVVEAAAVEADEEAEEGEEA